MRYSYRYIDCPYQGATIRYVRPAAGAMPSTWSDEDVQLLWQHLRLTARWVQPVIEGHAGPFVGPRPAPAVTAFLRRYSPLPSEGFGWTPHTVEFVPHPLPDE